MAEPDQNIPEDVEGEDEAPKSAGLLSLPFIGAAAGALIIATVAVFFLAPAPKAKAPHGEETEYAEKDELAKKEKKTAKAAKKKDSHGKSDGHGKDGGKDGSGGLEGGDLEQYAEHGYLLLDPIAISINPLEGTRYLRIKLALQFSGEPPEITTMNLLHARDALTTYLQSTNRKELEDPAYMSKIKYGVKRRIRAILPDLHIQSVLITEYLLT